MKGAGFPAFFLFLFFVKLNPQFIVYKVRDGLRNQKAADWEGGIL